MKQQCYIASIYLSFAMLIGGLVLFVSKGNYLLAVIWLAAAPLFQWLYIRIFPKISRYLGYGTVDDSPARVLARTQTTVRLYTALSCPFCPIMKRRLVDLQAVMGFDLEEVDVTLKPRIMMAKGIRAVPVVEVGAHRIVGHATSETLAELIRCATPYLAESK